MRIDSTAKAAGLVDVHVHIRDRIGLQAVAGAGVLAVRDGGLRENREGWTKTLRSRDALPAVIASGWALYKKGGYGARFGAAVETREEIKAEILKLKTAGADIIKIMASGTVSLREQGKVTAGGFSSQELRYIVGSAQDQGLCVMAHANGESAILSCAMAGVRSIEHGFFMTQRALDALARRDIFWTPTVGAFARAARPGPKAEVNNFQGFFNGLIRSHLAMIERAYTVGVPLAVGTDSVLPTSDYERAYGEELAYFEQAGIARGDVVSIATAGGARLLGI